MRCCLPSPLSPWLSRAGASEGPALTLITFRTLVLENRKQFSFRNEQIMSTALLIFSRKTLLGWRKSPMNLSNKWLGVMKSGTGWWGGEKPVSPAAGHRQSPSCLWGLH